ncbi:MAG: rRNA pseudouridine synthase [Spirochaetaceae bacterium]|jgi:23S rRNA pseudouridine2605 synthase|nr:rRNA pseudouridine synthase [Spirochaetaceae bacterium]
MPSDSIRLQVYLAHAGIASRRAAEKLIQDGRVTVNGAVVTAMGTRVAPGDAVAVDGKPVAPEEKKRYVLLNKPAGYVCTLSDEQGRPTAADLLRNRFPERLYNVGRLDMYSSGLIIFTNDGDFAARVAHPSSGIEKEYLLETTAPMPRGLCRSYREGFRIDGVFYRALEAQELSPRRCRIVLVEGKNREIRRMFEHFQCPIRSLTRVRIGSLRIDGLYEGDFRELTPPEVAEFLGAH